MKEFLTDKRVLETCHIYKMLSAAAKRKHVSFHTPGHKRGAWDITELSFSDNLSCPRGPIAEAQRDIARILGAKQSFILTDGSTSGVMSMAYAAKKCGVKTLAACMQSHKSLFNACSVLGLGLVAFEEERENGRPLPITASESVKAALEKADGLFVTSPDYYGNVADLAALRALCDEQGKPLIVDGAHGGHLHFDKELYAGAYADMWVDGVHKSLPAFTQGAVVSARGEAYAAALSTAVDAFRTTSPSYPIMASVEYAVKYPRNVALEEKTRAFAKENERVVLGRDWTKVCVKFGKNAFEADAYLQARGVYSEFCDGNVIMFYLSPATSMKEFEVLAKSIRQVCDEFEYAEIQPVPAPVLSSIDGEKKWVEIREAIGKTCAETCGLFPPCVPLIAVGETVSEEKAERLLLADNVFGVKDGKIAVIVEENEA